MPSKIHFSLGRLLLDKNESDKENNLPTKLLFATTKDILYGDELVSFSNKDLKEIKRNFDNNELGNDVVLNYNHTFYNDGRAAGWVDSLQYKATDDGVGQLFADVTWTPNGKEDVIGKVYKYTSVGVFHDAISANDNHTRVGKTLFEISLTNTPADNNLEAIQQMSKKLNEEKKDMTDKDKTSLELTKELLEKNITLENSNKKIIELESKVKEVTQKFLAEKKRTLQLDREKTIDKMIIEKEMVPAQKEKALELSEDQFEGFKLAMQSRPKETYSNNPKSLEGNNNLSEESTDAMDKKIITLQSKYEKDGLTESGAYDRAYNEVYKK